MKKDDLYNYYILYLNDRLIIGDLNIGSFSLLKISENSFDDFKYKFINDKKFSKQLVRDKKINDLLNGID